MSSKYAVVTLYRIGRELAIKTFDDWESAQKYKEESMIKLEVEDYCHNCPHFESDVETATCLYTDGSTEPCIIGDTIIRCAHKHICECVKKTHTEVQSK